MLKVVFYCAASCLLASVACGDSVDGYLLVRADAPQVEIAAAAAGHRIIDLPTIEYLMQVETACHNELLAESVSISVADSRVRLGATDLSAEDPVEKTIRIPASQIAPLAIDNFCIAEDADVASVELPERQPVLLRDVLSAQVSLRCASEERQVIVYQTLALEVALSCESTSADEQEDN